MPGLGLRQSFLLLSEREPVSDHAQARTDVTLSGLGKAPLLSFDKAAERGTAGMTPGDSDADQPFAQILRQGCRDQRIGKWGMLSSRYSLPFTTKPRDS